MTFVQLDAAVNDLDARAAEAMEHFPYHRLMEFAVELAAGEPLEKFCNGITVEELLRGLAFPTIYREMRRRAEVAALEDEATGA
jgi:hypothetical protein